jgi:hypothetical protein
MTDRIDNEAAPGSTGRRRYGAGGAARLGGAIAGVALRPAARMVRLGGRAAEDLTLATVDRVLESRVAGEVVDRIADSPLVQRGIGRAMEGPLVEQLGRDLVRYAVVERVTEVVLDGDLVDRTAARVLDGPEFDRVVDQALDSPAMERLVGRVIESKLLDEAVARLLESEELWLLVDEIARSPAVTEAITQQSLGFADQVAGGVRARSRSMDDWLERKARRALGRGPAPGSDAR